MSRKVNTALASSIVIFALLFIEPAAVPASHDGPRYHNQNHQQATKRARRAASRAGRRSKAKKARWRAISYVCPMHPDIREKGQGTCPKCLMDLRVEDILYQPEASGDYHL